MNPVNSAIGRALAVMATLLIAHTLVGQRQAGAQLGQGDIVLGRSEASESFRVYDASAGTWSNGPGWSPTFMQSVEFDNSGSISHNASGNLLAANFGSSYTGFEVQNLATNGTSNSESAWSIVEATGGTIGEQPGDWLSLRGGGMSISPDNSHLAWSCYDTGEIYVHDYSAGATPGAGSGASLSGPRHTDVGDGNGNAGTLTALKAGGSQGTAWLSDTTVAAFNSFGEIITWDISGVAAGSEDGTSAGWAPTLAPNWVIANAEVAFDAQFTDIEYNALIDPDHIYSSVTKNGSYEAELFAYDYDAETGSITLNKRMVVPNAPNGEPREPREIALDADGSLYYSGYAGSGGDNVIMRLPDATDIAAWNAANVAVFYTSGDYTGYNGMDVAASVSDLPPGLYGDYNDDGTIDAADYTVWRDTLAAGTSLTNDSTPGTVDESDYLYWKAHYGESVGAGSGSGTLAAAAVPEPGTLTLLALAMGAMALSVRRGA